MGTKPAQVVDGEYDDVETLWGRRLLLLQLEYEVISSLASGVKTFTENVKLKLEKHCVRLGG